MKLLNTGFVILGIGIVSSIANIVVNWDNDSAVWGWLSSAAWCAALFVREISDNK